MNAYDKRWAANKKGIEDAHFTELKEQILKQEVGKNKEKYFARFVGPDVMKSEFFNIKYSRYVTYSNVARRSSEIKLAH